MRCSEGTYLDLVAGLRELLGGQVVGALLHGALRDPLQQLGAQLGVRALRQRHLLGQLLRDDHVV